MTIPPIHTIIHEHKPTLSEPKNRSVKERVAIVALGILSSAAIFATLPTAFAAIVITGIGAVTINYGFGPFPSNGNEAREEDSGEDTKSLSEKTRRPIYVPDPSKKALLAEIEIPDSSSRAVGKLAEKISSSNEPTERFEHVSSRRSHFTHGDDIHRKVGSRE